MDTIAGAGLTFVGVKRADNKATFVTLRGPDAEIAKAFLCRQTVDQELCYLVIETPGGTWGLDIRTIYLESLKLCPIAPRDADCAGTISAVVDGGDTLLQAARGASDNFVVMVTCGRCGNEWLDGVTYRDLTVLRCPGCAATNRVDSFDIVVTPKPFGATFDLNVPLRSSRRLLPPPATRPSPLNAGPPNVDEPSSVSGIDEPSTPQDIFVGMSQDDLISCLGSPTFTVVDKYLLPEYWVAEGTPPAQVVWIYQDIPPGHLTTVALDADHAVARVRVESASAAARTPVARAPNPPSTTTRGPEAWRPTNTMAILALVFAFVFAPAGVILGLVAHRQIDRTSERGKELATAGVTVGIILSVVSVVALWFAAMAGDIQYNVTGSGTAKVSYYDGRDFVSKDVTLPFNTNASPPLDYNGNPRDATIFVQGSGWVDCEIDKGGRRLKSGHSESGIASC